MKKFKVELKNYLDRNKEEKNSKEILNIFLSGFPYENYHLDDNIINYINDEMHNLDDLIIKEKNINFKLNKILKATIRMIDERTKTFKFYDEIIPDYSKSTKENEKSLKKYRNYNKKEWERLKKFNKKEEKNN